MKPICGATTMTPPNAGNACMPPCSAICRRVARWRGASMLTPSGCRPRRRSTPSSSRRAAHAGVLIEPGARHFLNAAPPDNYFRMGFHAINPDAIARGGGPARPAGADGLAVLFILNGVAHAEQRRAQTVERHRSERNAQRLRIVAETQNGSAVDTEMRRSISAFASRSARLSSPRGSQTKYESG